MPARFIFPAHVTGKLRQHLGPSGDSQRGLGTAKMLTHFAPHDLRQHASTILLVPKGSRDWKILLGRFSSTEVPSLKVTD